MDGLRRVGVSLGSVAIAVVLSSVVISLATERRLDPGWFFIFSIFAVPGWLISIPMVLVMRKFDGWRFWVSLVAGTMIGPALVETLYGEPRIIGWSGMPVGILGVSRIYVLLAAGVCFIGTSIYLYVYREASVRAREWRWKG
jgi:hypothetical protein